MSAAGGRRLWGDIYVAARRFWVIYGLLSKAARRQFWLFQACTLTNFFLGSAALGGLAGILVLLSNPTMLFSNPTLFAIYNFVGLGSGRAFLSALCVAFMLFVLAQRAIVTFCTWLNMRAQQFIVRGVSLQLYEYHLVQDYEYRPLRDSNEALEKILNAGGQVLRTVLFGNMSIVPATINIAAVVAVLLAVDAAVTLAMLSAALLYYTVFYRVLRERLSHYGKRQHRVAVGKLQRLRAGLGSVTEVMFMGKERQFIEHYREALVEGEQITLWHTLVNAIMQPMLTTLGTLFVLGIGVYTLATGSAQAVFPIVAAFVAGGMRLAPALQQVYGILMSMRSVDHIYDALLGDLYKARDAAARDRAQNIPTAPSGLRREVALEGARYAYPGKRDAAVRDASLRLPIGDVAALCGPSGGGKTTVARLLCGLLRPQAGRVVVDGKSLWDDLAARRGWQLSVSFLQQHPYFFNDSIAANVAFAIDEREIDYARIEAALADAQLADFVADLPDGMRTEIGERGLRLSGGQMQRLAIARAVYRNVALMIFDETTNALDAITEKKIIDNIMSRRRKTTILIIAHRIEVMREADRIYVVEDGRLRAEGRYDELLESDALFRQLARQYTEEAEAEQGAEAGAREGAA